MVKTLSKLTLRPRSAIEMRLSRASPPFSSSLARFRTSLLEILTCKSAGVGSVFLKSSRASSSLRILMVSARANCSSARNFWRTAHSSFFRGAILLQIGQEFLILHERFLGVLQIIRHVDNLDAHLTDPGRLLLNHFSADLHLFLLG